MKSKTIIQCLLVCLSLSGATDFTLNSQETAPKPPREGGQPLPPPMMAGLGPVANVFTEDQRASFRKAMEEQRETVRDLETKLHDARGKLFTQGLDGKFDEAAVRSQALAVATLEAEMSVARARALSQIQPPLSAEQLTKIKTGISNAPRRGDSRMGERLEKRIQHQNSLTATNRDENDLPPKH